MDKSHANFMRVMKEDPSVDEQALIRQFPKNYSDTLRLKDASTLDRGTKRGAAGRGHQDDEEEDSLENAKIDSFDQKLLKEGRIEFIGVERRIDTNLRPFVPKEESLEKGMRSH